MDMSKIGTVFTHMGESTARSTIAKVANGHCDTHPDWFASSKVKGTEVFVGKQPNSLPGGAAACIQSAGFMGAQGVWPMFELKGEILYPVLWQKP